MLIHVESKKGEYRMTENQTVNYEVDERRIETVIIFKELPRINVDIKRFSRSHYFKDNEMTKITPEFKNILLELFNVSNVKELKEIMKEEYSLVFEEGEGIPKRDEITKVVTVFVETVREIVKKNNIKKKYKKSIDNIIDGNDVAGNSIVSIIGEICNTESEITYTDVDKKKLAKMIPRLIKSGELKISIDDITDINKERLSDIIEIGRSILKKDKSVCKILDIDKADISNEIAWQKYFDIYGSYILFGSIKKFYQKKL